MLMLDISTGYFKLIALSTKTRKFCAPFIITTQMRKLCTVLAGNFRVPSQEQKH